MITSIWSKTSAIANRLFFRSAGIKSCESTFLFYRLLLYLQYSCVGLMDEIFIITFDITQNLHTYSFFSTFLISNSHYIKTMETIQVQVIITNKSDINSGGQNKHFVNGLDDLQSVISELNFNNNETIFVYIEHSVDTDEINKKLLHFCKLLKQSGKVSDANYSQSGCPNTGDSYHTRFDVNSKILENRYMLTH